MLGRFKSKSVVLFGSGVAAGLLVAAAFMSGQVIGNGDSSARQPTLAEQLLGHTPLHASGATGGKSIAIATGMMDEGTEGVFILDFLTGDLQCWVINPRSGTFSSIFKINVIADLGIEQGKAPDYVMTTGTVDVRGPTGNAMGRSFVYVADGNTGNVACYAVPWNRQAVASGAPQVGALARVAVGKARVVAVQE
jgi:hypothetical protein